MLYAITTLIWLSVLSYFGFFVYLSGPEGILIAFIPPAILFVLAGLWAAIYQGISRGRWM